MSSFEPIAIVGRACLLPGAHSPEALLANVLAGRDLVSSAPSGRWGLSPAQALTPDPARADDRAWSDRGGYVQGFEAAFDPTGFEVPPETLAGLDPLFLWVLHTARAALRDGGDGARARTGAIVGNLSFPSGQLAQRAARTWLGDELADRFSVPATDARNTFMSGLPAHLLAAALGLGGEAFALDAACASSLYAIGLACDALHDRRADVMLAGAVNRADDLFIHVGFCALSALSKSGRSRPFDAGADGLLPAEGAGFVVLKRLADAERDGDVIHAVIRGVGLSNDGRGRGMLAPSEAGQIRALEQAYAAAGLDPRTVQYVECHATGTPVGDATELRSMRAVFGGQKPVGSLKANLGHLITAAGVAAVIKVVESMRHGMLPPTPHVSTPNPELASSGFEVLATPRAWSPDADGVRRAGVSAFGFGGNNAHVVLESYRPGLPVAPSPAPRTPLAITGIGLRVADLPDAASFAEALVRGESRVRLRDGAVRSGHADSVAVSLAGLRFPPKDLEATLAQQTLLLAACRDALRGRTLPSTRTAVLVGTQCDPEVARYGARWRSAAWAEAAGLPDETAASMREAFVPVLRAAGVLGTMPNIPANRLNGQFDLGGPSFTVAAEEASGVRALQIAMRGLRAGTLDAAVVGASDLAAEPVHESALAEVLGVRPPAGDAAVVLVLERLDDATALGRPILAILDEPDDAPHAVLGVAGATTTLGPLVGRAHAASGLLHVAAAALLLGRRALVGESGPVDRARVVVEALLGQRALVCVRAADADLPSLGADLPSPLLTLPAHPPQPRLPALHARRPEHSVPVATPSSPQVTPMRSSMPAAPALPKTSFDAPHVPSARHASPVAHAPAAVAPIAPAAVPVVATPTLIAAPQVASPVYAAPTDATSADPVLSLVAGLVAEQARSHQAFVESQRRMHASYLALREQLTLGLAQAASLDGAGVEFAWPTADAPATVAAVPALAVPPVVTNAPVVAPTVPTSAAAIPSAAPAAGARRPSLPVSTATPTGPTFDRAALEVHASGTISQIFGPAFEGQDGYAVQVRMPEPPLLLADRVVGLVGEPKSMGKGTVFTETDIREDSWFLHDGYAPAGVLIECGQADLFLISYLGIDFLNRGERAYRLLGCELTYHGDLPHVGETIRYDIHVDGHANHGAVRLFFFHYDCHATDSGRRVISVREGQAGFFTRAELDDSAGVLWTPEEQAVDPAARVDPPAVARVPASLDRVALERFAAGDAFGCFGAGYEFAQTHNRGPRIAGGRMLFQDAVTHLDPAGGPWKRGYLRAVQAIRPDDWFFDGHFKNDPCMPGTLMFEGCLSMMALYLGALGHTLVRDGWRFQPQTGVPFPLLCRGQVVPTSKELVYELFVEEVHDGPVPRLVADLLCTVDGLKAFHARRMSLELVPDWPLTSQPGILRDHVEAKPVASADGFRFDYASLLACAWGKPSDAFGPMYRVFDGTRKVARLPGPPYHFMSRVTRADGPIGVCKPGAVIEIEYDVPPAEWYFRENGYPSMPFCVFLEAALQPCGWLASYVGSALTVPDDLMFRNLDGEATFLAEVFPTSGTFRTVVKITNISQSAGMIIESFDVDCYVGDVQVYDLKTVFGFFPKSAFENQVGLPVDDAERAKLTAASSYRVDLTERPAKYFTGTARLPQPMLLMLDRVTAFDASGGKSGKGFARGEKDVDPAEWFFKAHFFQDPVQPGSLGLEAMLQLLQFTMIELGLTEGVQDARFEPILVGRKHVWKYRGQVVPKNRLISSTLDVVEVGRDERGTYVLADASLWVDGKRIYEMKALGMRVVSGGLGGPDPVPGDTSGKAPSRPARTTSGSSAAPAEEFTLSLATEPFLLDHQPTFVVPSLPMMSMVDLMLGDGATVDGPVALADVHVHRWLTVPSEARVRVERDGAVRRVLVHRTARDPRLSRFELVAEGRRVEPTAPRTLPPLVGARPAADPYEEGTLFHGPSFRGLVSLAFGQGGAHAVIDVARISVPRGATHQGLLDALTHAIPHDRLSLFTPQLDDTRVGYPHRIRRLVLHRAMPTDGLVTVEVRFDGFDGGERFPAFLVEATHDGAPLVSLELVEVLMPKGPLGRAEPRARRRFLEAREPMPGVSLTHREGDETVLRRADVTASDWLPGTLRAVYRIDGGELPRAIAVAEHVAARVGEHPSRVVAVEAGGVRRARPLELLPVAVTEGRDELRVRDAGPPRRDLALVRAFWRETFGLGPWPVEDLYYGLLDRFVDDVIVRDPDGLAAVAGRPVLFLANHQTGIESLLFSIVASALVRTPTLTLAKVEHRESWLGRLIRTCFSYPGVVDPGVIAHFDRDDPKALPALVRSLVASAHERSKSLMIHVEGTRALAAGQPIARMSGVFLDLASAASMPIVPVRFTGGLPIEPLETRTEYPVGYGRQSIHFGSVIDPRSLAALPYKARIDRVAQAIDAAAPDLALDRPTEPDPAFAARVDALVHTLGMPAPYAVVAATLEANPDCTPETRQVLDALAGLPGTRTPFADALAALLLRG